MSVEEYPMEDNRNTIVQEWVELYTADLLLWAVKRTSNRLVAEDLVQDTYISAYQNFHKFESRSSPKTWLISILSNKINDHFRKLYKDNSLIVATDVYDMFDEHENWKPEYRPVRWENTDSHILDNLEFITVLTDCLDALPAQWKSIMHLKYLSDWKSISICQELGITDTNLWQMVHRAKMQLRKCLEVHWFNSQQL